MEKTPTRVTAAAFAAKVFLFRVRRGALNFLHPVPLHAPQPGKPSEISGTVRSITSLWTDAAPSEQWYQRGKVENLRLAAERLDGCVIPAEQVFSFWRQVGRITARRGFLPGRMLQEGCLIPSVGGGLCQLSNALYQVAMEAGCDILERHPHSRTVPGSATAAGRDATVAWNYVDLRFRPKTELTLEVRLTAEHLVVALRGDIAPASERPLNLQGLQAPPNRSIGDDHACDTCGREECFRHPSNLSS